MAINVSMLFKEITMYIDYLESILSQNATTTNSTLPHETSNAQKMDNLICLI
jgi:hypothetical protein